MRDIIKRKDKASYIRGIEGLRALAISAVIIYHFYPENGLPGGFTGVDVFFVLSGFVIAKSLRNRDGISFLPWLKGFYARRIRRILPPLLVCLVITMTAAVLFIPPSWMNRTIHQSGLAAFWGMGNISLLLNYNGYFSPSMDYNPFLHTWSLGVEEQFYLLFPFLFFPWISNNKYTQGRFLLPLFTVASFALTWILSSTQRDAAYFLLPTRFWELAVGALLYKGMEKRSKQKLKKPMRLLLRIGGLILITAGFFFADPWAFPLPWALLPVGGSLLVILSLGLQGTNSGGFILCNPLMDWLGKRSYSLYLWHWPVIVLFRWTTGLETPFKMGGCLLLILVLALCSYRWVEGPFRSIPVEKKEELPRLFLYGTAAVILFFSAAYIIQKGQHRFSLSVTRDSYIWRSGRHWQDKTSQTQHQIPELEGRKIFALGDSHTAAYRTMLHQFSHRNGVEVIEFEEGGMAVAGLLKPLGQDPDFQKFYNRAYEEIAAQSNPGDILFLASLRMPELSYRFEGADVDSIIRDFFSPQSEENRELALEEADRIIKEFQALGLTVLIEAPLPVLLIPPYRCSDWFNRGNPIGEPGPTIARSLLEEIRYPQLVSIETLKSRNQNLQIWDPFTVLCQKDLFSAYDKDGLPLFYDGDHLSGHGNRVLLPSFEEKVLQLFRENQSGL